MADLHATLASRLNYAQCWEDERVLRAALRVSPGQRVLSIASAGDNSFALAYDGAEVVAVDLSPAQLAVCALKLAGRGLSYAQYRQLLGVDRGLDPVELCRRVRPLLPADAAAFWDAHPELLRAGVVHHGRFERYLALFRTRILPLVHRRRTVEALFDSRDLAEQQRFYAERWDRRRWRTLFRLFFSQRVMAARGRSPEQFAHVKGPVGDAFLARAKHALTEIPLRDNGYVQQMLLGTWIDEQALPPYLTREGHRRLGEVAERVRFVQGALQEVLPREGTFDAFNLSDLFEYLSPALTEELYGRVLGAARPGARIAYWNLLVPREVPASLADRVEKDEAGAAALLAGDRAFVYGAFRREVVR